MRTLLSILLLIVPMASAQSVIFPPDGTSAGSGLSSGNGVVGEIPPAGARAGGVTGATALTSAALSTGAVIRVPKAGDLAYVGFTTGTVTINAASTLRVSFQTVDDTDGFPDETADEYRLVGPTGIASDTIYKTGLMTSDGTDTGTVRTVTRGEYLGIMIGFGTFTGGDSVVISTGENFSTAQTLHNFTYRVDMEAEGSTTKDAQYLPMLTLYYSDGAAYVYGMQPAFTETSYTYASDSASDAYGLHFTLPGRARIVGMWAAGDFVGGDTNFILYSVGGATTVASVDSNITHTATGLATRLWFETAVEVSANTDYVLALEPQTTTSSILYGWQLADGDATIAATGSSTFYLAYAKDPTDTTSFTMDDSQVPLMGLLIDQMIP